MSEFKNHHVTLNAAFKEAVFDFVPGDKPENFWVITAYNPDGQDTDEISNQLADEKLYAELNALGVEPECLITCHSGQSINRGFIFRDPRLVEWLF